MAIANCWRRTRAGGEGSWGGLFPTLYELSVSLNFIRIFLIGEDDLFELNWYFQTLELLLSIEGIYLEICEDWSKGSRMFSQDRITFFCRLKAVWGREWADLIGCDVNSKQIVKQFVYDNRGKCSKSRSCSEGSSSSFIIQNYFQILRKSFSILGNAKCKFHLRRHSLWTAPSMPFTWANALDIFRQIRNS